MSVMAPVRAINLALDNSDTLGQVLNRHRLLADDRAQRKRNKQHKDEAGEKNEVRCSLESKHSA